MNPQNGILGDAQGIDLPQYVPDEISLNEEKNKARYSKSKEFKQIRAYCENRIKFYQTYLPDGREIGLDFTPSPSDWRVANRVIGEFKALMNIYDTAKETVEEIAKDGR